MPFGADVRSRSGVPLVADFGGANGTPIVVDTDNGDLYVLVAGAVKKAAGSSVAAGLTATGTTQGTAYALTAMLSQFTTVASGTGAILYGSLTAGNQQIVYNGGANPLKVYPSTGAKINQLATNAAMLLAVNTACTFMYLSATQWIGSLSA